jgi:hypothetical protein
VVVDQPLALEDLVALVGLGALVAAEALGVLMGRTPELVKLVPVGLFW